MLWFFEIKNVKLDTLTRFCSDFSSKLSIFGHISEVSFDRKCIKVIDILIFIMENRTVFFVFLLNRSVFEKTVKINTWVDFRIKAMKKWNFWKVKLEFYNTDRKVKSTIRCIFMSIIIHRYFMHFYQKTTIKSALEIFTPICGHLKTILKKCCFFFFLSFLN